MSIVCRSLASLVLVLVCSSCGAAPEIIPPQAAKVALVIGNGAYQSVPPLANPPKDARAVAAALTGLGFHTELVEDASKDGLKAALRRLGDASSGETVAVLYYAGHASEVGGQNLLIPVSASAIGRPEDLEEQAVSFDEITQLLQGKAHTTLIFLDACRDNPFMGFAPSPTPVKGEQAVTSDRATRSLSRAGLASVNAESGMLIAFATAPGHVAMDGSSEHSPFTEALLRHIATPDIEVRQMLTEVRRDVEVSTHGQQVPWDNSSLDASFFFKPTTAQSLAKEPSRIPRDGTHFSFIVDPGQTTPIWRYATPDRQCYAISLPEISATTPPQHGTLLVQPEKFTMNSVRVSGPEYCIGHLVSGVAVYYKSEPGFHGIDRVEYDVIHTDVMHINAARHHEQVVVQVR